MISEWARNYSTYIYPIFYLLEDGCGEQHTSNFGKEWTATAPQVIGAQGNGGSIGDPA